MERKTITIFGSSKPKPGDEEYETAYKLGKILGKNGLNICTGGYQGIMDAVSKGASEEGVDAIGITVDIFSASPSVYLTERISANSLFERIENLISLADGFIILRGGTGTMVELSIVWEYINKGLMPRKPVCIHGEMWLPIIESINSRMKIEGRIVDAVNYFKKIEDCADYIIRELSSK